MAENGGRVFWPAGNGACEGEGEGEGGGGEEEEGGSGLKEDEQWRARIVETVSADTHAYTMHHAPMHPNPSTPHTLHPTLGRVWWV